MHSLASRTALTALVFLLPLASCEREPTASSPRSPADTSRPVAQLSLEAPETAVLVGAGDIASCTSTGDEATASLLDAIPGTVFAAGDNVYEYGTLSDFTTCYDPSWGRHKSRTRPAAGDREYKVSGAGGHYSYFGTAAGDSAKYYYSYDVGAWHVVVLNSSISTSAGSAQEKWLRSDLAASTHRCTIAIWHNPLFYSSGSSSSIKPLWTALYQIGAELVINAHRRNYERFAPQTPDGVANPTHGIRQFIVGTGGISHGSFGSPRANSEVRDKTSYGVLKLTLESDHYTWEFVPIAGATFKDSGTGECHDAPPPVANAGPSPRAEATVTFDGSASTDPSNNPPLSYDWDFGDGSPHGTGVKPTHTYTADGAHIVTLIVSNAKGARSAPATTTAMVENFAPTVNAGPDARVDVGDTFTMSASFTDPGTGDSPWSFKIDWGDGTPPATGSVASVSTPISATHTYTASGQYTARATVTDKDDGAASDDRIVVVAAPGTPEVLVGAGDVATCSGDNDEATAKLLDGTAGMVFTAGDNAGSNGSASDFTNCYDPTWGRHKARTKPAVGERDYNTTDASGYYGYYGAAAGEVSKYYYSYDLGTWHIVVLNSSISMSAGSPQELWLKADLAATAKACVLAVWHYPRFSSSTSSIRSAVKPIWDALYAAGADVVVNAHYRNYERLAPQKTDGTTDMDFGIRQFVVGTGGAGSGSFSSTVRPNSEVRNTGTPGVLKLSLEDGGYAWQFIPIAGKTFKDAGYTLCHSKPKPIARPGGPYRSEAGVQFDGSASSDPANGSLTYDWDFGDGTPHASGAKPTHVFASDGEYVATLTVMNGKGERSDSKTTAVTVANVRPAVIAGYDAKTRPGKAYGLSARFSDPGAGDAPWRYTIEWGDGSSDVESTDAQSAPIDGTHVFAAPGAYTVSVTVTDKDGGADTDQLVVRVISVASVTVSPATAAIEVGTAQQFTATVRDADGYVVTDAQVVWSSSNTSAATIDETGVATSQSALGVTITATSEGKSGSAGLYPLGLPFGPFHLPDANFSAPFTGLLRGSHPEDVVATLEEARKAHFRVMLRLVRGSSRFQNPDGSFSLELWKQEVDRYAGIDLNPYIADGTIIGHYLLDEPRDPTNWGGQPMPYATIDAAAQYSKQLWPTLPAGVGSPPSQLSDGVPFTYLDFAFAQYRAKKGDVKLWLENEINTARAAGLGVMLSLNVLEGGSPDHTPMTSEQLRTWGLVLGAEPYVCALTLWKYDDLDPSYFNDAAHLAAMADVALVANARAGRPCRKE
jgi:PKD repeat protein